MRRLGWLAVLSSFAVASAGKAWAEDPPPPPPVEAPAPAPAVTSPAPMAQPPMAPTPDESRRIVEMAPPSGQPVYTMPPPNAGCNVCCGPQPCAQRRDDCGWAIDNCGCLYGPLDITLEAMASWISDPDGSLGELVTGNPAPLDWNDVDYPIAIGGRLTISYRYEAQTRVELRATYWGQTDESSTKSGFFGAFPGASGDGDLSRFVEADMQSEAELWGVELNWWTEVSCSGKTRIDAGLGLRYVNFNEVARVDFTTLDIGPFPVADGFVESEAQNDFLGFQAMIAGHIDVSQCLELYGSAKGMVGQIARDIDVSDDSIFAGGPHSSASDDDEFVFGVDFELGFKWRISNRIAITGGYELFFLDEVQRAEDGMDFSRSDTGAVQAIQNPDQLVVHSLFLGISINL